MTHQEGGLTEEHQIGRTVQDPGAETYGHLSSRALPHLRMLSLPWKIHQQPGLSSGREHGRVLVPKVKVGHFNGLRAQAKQLACVPDLA